VPFQSASGRIHVYSLPISRDTFDDYHEELAAVFNRCFGTSPQDLALTGPSVAFSALKKAAKALRTWDTPSGVENGLVNELIRLTSVAVASPSGRQILPMATAQERGVIDDVDSREILNQLVFFSAASTAGPPQLFEELMPVMEESRDWVRTSLSASAYLDSLKPSTQETTSEAVSPQSVIVS